MRLPASLPHLLSPSMLVLVLNSGSSSIQYRLVGMPQRRTLTAGIVERIGEGGERHPHRTRIGREKAMEVTFELEIAEQTFAFLGG